MWATPPRRARHTAPSVWRGRAAYVRKIATTGNGGARNVRHTHTHTHTRARARARPAPLNPIVGGGNSSTRSRPNVHPPSDGRDDDDDGDDYDDDAAAAAATGRRTVPSVSQSVYVARLRCAQTYYACQYVSRDRSLAGSSEIVRTSLSLPRNSHSRNSTVGPRLIVLPLSLPRSLYLSVACPQTASRPRACDNFLHLPKPAGFRRTIFFPDFYSVKQDFCRLAL